jgi:hypothetical protein
MKTFCLLPVLGLFLVSISMNAQVHAPATHSESLQKLVDSTAQKTLQDYAEKKLLTNEFAITLIDLKNPEKPAQASFRGDVQIYPASVIKLFYLVAAHRWMEDSKIKDTEEFRRGLRDMIVDSLNEATGYIVDSLTDTTSGPEMSDKDLAAWWEKRNAVNHFFTSLGYTNINVSKKPWCEGPYGRETQAIKAFTPKRNWLTTDATARLLSEIVTGKAVSKKRCDEMMELLKRDPFTKGDSSDQAHAFTGASVPPGTKLWSKAGWTSETRHDAAYLELPTGEKFVLVVFTVNHASDNSLVPFVAKAVIDQMSSAAH